MAEEGPHREIKSPSQDRLRIADRSRTFLNISKQLNGEPKLSRFDDGSQNASRSWRSE